MAPWEPLFHRFAALCTEIKRTAPFTPHIAPLYRDPALYTAKKLIKRSMLAFRQGVLLSRKVEDMRTRLQKAAAEGSNEFYHSIWNQLTVYVGVAEMYAAYFSKISEETDQLLSALELQVYVHMPQ